MSVQQELRAYRRELKRIERQQDSGTSRLPAVIAGAALGALAVAVLGPVGIGVIGVGAAGTWGVGVSASLGFPVAGGVLGLAVDGLRR